MRQQQKYVVSKLLQSHVKIAPCPEDKNCVMKNKIFESSKYE